MNVDSDTSQKVKLEKAYTILAVQIRYRNFKLEHNITTTNSNKCAKNSKLKKF